MNYTKEQVDEMLSQVEQEFEKTLGVITKSEKDNEIKASEDKPEEVEMEAGKMDKSEEVEQEEAGEEEYETIDDLYSSMTKSEKAAHYASVKKALFGEEEEGESKMAKSEASEEKKMSKSEEELKAENEELQKSLNTMNELVDKIFSKGKSAPKQKSITESYDVIAKSESEKEKEIDLSELSKGEVTAKLKKVDYSSLKKSDREAINNFYLENGSVEKIKHLIME